MLLLHFGYLERGEVSGVRYFSSKCFWQYHHSMPCLPGKGQVDGCSCSFDKWQAGPGSIKLVALCYVACCLFAYKQLLGTNQWTQPSVSNDIQIKSIISILDQQQRRAGYQGHKHDLASQIRDGPLLTWSSVQDRLPSYRQLVYAICCLARCFYYCTR